MNYSFAFVLCLGALVLQCSGRPQQLPLDLPGTSPAPTDTSSPPAEQVQANAESATEVTQTGEQVVFDEGEPVVGETNDDDTDAPTTSEPGQETQQDEVTTTPPCSGDDCSSPVIGEDAPNTDDAPAAPSEDDATEVTTMPPSDSS